MPLKLCQHVHASGKRCQSPSMDRAMWCYFHQTLHQRHARYRHTKENRDYVNFDGGIQLTALEDSESVQIAISCVVNALATNNMNAKRAMALFYGLQLAATNAARLKPAPPIHETVRDIGITNDGLEVAVENFEPLEIELQKTPEPYDPVHLLSPPVQR